MYELGTYRPLALVEGNAKKGQKTRTFWYQNDHLGTPHSLTDSLGELVYSCTYNAYGQLRTETQHQQEERGIRVETNLRFQGQYWDEETGLHYNLNRYYDPGLGRYLTVDPIGLLGGINQYQYVDGNPTNWIDPLGLLKGIDGKKTTNATDVSRTTQDVMRKHLDDIKLLDPDAEVGYRGSLARGQKGPHKDNADFDPTDFDIDAFIVSDKLASQYSPKTYFKDGTNIPELKVIQESIENELRSQPSMSGLRDGIKDKFTFRIYTKAQIQRKLDSGDIHVTL